MKNGFKGVEITPNSPVEPPDIQIDHGFLKGIWKRLTSRFWNHTNEMGKSDTSSFKDLL